MAICSSVRPYLLKDNMNFGIELICHGDYVRNNFWRHLRKIYREQDFLKFFHNIPFGKRLFPKKPIVKHLNWSMHYRSSEFVQSPWILQ